MSGGAGADALVTRAKNAGELVSGGLRIIDDATVDMSDWGGFDIDQPAEGTDRATRH